MRSPHSLYVTTNISMKPEEYAYVKQQMLSFSKIFQRALQDLREGNTTEVLFQRIRKLEIALDLANREIDKLKQERLSGGIR